MGYTCICMIYDSEAEPNGSGKGVTFKTNSYKDIEHLK